LPAARARHCTILALSLGRAEQDAATAWFDERGVAWRAETFGWIGWRGVFVTDPEGHTFEPVACDPGLGVSPPAP